MYGGILRGSIRALTPCLCTLRPDSYLCFSCPVVCCHSWLNPYAHWVPEDAALSVVAKRTVNVPTLHEHDIWNQRATDPLDGPIADGTPET